MSDNLRLVANLRHSYNKVKAGFGAAGMYLECKDAADAIEQLDADNARLRKAIQDAPHGNNCDFWESTAKLTKKETLINIRPCTCWKRNALETK